MGWASGSSVLWECWQGIKRLIPEYQRVEAAKVLIKAFEEADCDTIDECFEDPYIKAAAKELHPEWFEDEE